MCSLNFFATFMNLHHNSGHFFVFFFFTNFNIWFIYHYTYYNQKCFYWMLLYFYFNILLFIFWIIEMHFYFFVQSVRNILTKITSGLRHSIQSFKNRSFLQHCTGLTVCFWTKSRPHFDTQTEAYFLMLVSVLYYCKSFKNFLLFLYFGNRVFK